MDQYENSMELYEKVPQGIAPVRFRIHDDMSPPGFLLHWHEHLEIHYMIEGHSIVQCGNDTVELTKDQFLIVNSNELHQGIAGMCRYAYMLLTPTFFKMQHVLLCRTVRDPFLSEIMHKMIAEYYTPDAFTQDVLTGYAHLFLTHLYRNFVYKRFDEYAYSSYSQRMLGLNSAIKYIHDHYDEDISLDTAAKNIGFSKYHFCNVFKEFTGETFKEYLNRIRIRKAIELLGATDIPITQIAFLCGFQDSNYFSRKFRQITGKTPRMIRNEKKASK